MTISMGRASFGFLVLAAVLSGCGASGGAAPAPQMRAVRFTSAEGALPELRSSGEDRITNFAAARLEPGLYVSDEVDIFGFPATDGHDLQPFCEQRGPGFIVNIAFDGQGHLIFVNQLTSVITVFKATAHKGPCGEKLGSFKDFGGAIDAASLDAAHGIIAVANVAPNFAPGNVAICTLAGGCTRKLTNRFLRNPVGIALAKNGDCWVNSGHSSVGHLTYFPHCSGHGQIATGFSGTYSGGGLDVDAHGNLVAIDESAKSVSVFSGCAPACSLVGGPFPLHGASFYGHLNQNSTRLALGDVDLNQVDVYDYSPTAITFKYGFFHAAQSGGEDGTFGVAYNPRAKE